MSGSLHDSTAVTIASGADYNVNASDTVASIEGAGNIVIASSQTLTAGDGNDKTLSGVISGAGNYIKAWYADLECFEHLYWYDAGECGNIDSFGIRSII